VREIAEKPGQEVTKLEALELALELLQFAVCLSLSLTSLTLTVFCVLHARERKSPSPVPPALLSIRQARSLQS
jgi:hypothetical protein